jgi:hypothetical protein
MPKYAEEQKNIFEGLDPEQIAEQVERDIKQLAREWRSKPYNRLHARPSAMGTVATRVVATYLSRHTQLYARDDTASTKQNHQHWLDLMRTWFLDALREKGE